MTGCPLSSVMGRHGPCPLQNKSIGLRFDDPGDHSIGSPCPVNDQLSFSFFLLRGVG
jgi:hypothetical protein